MRKLKTKILATLGPATDTPSKVLALARAGASSFRLNFSHGDFAFHERLVESVKQAEDKLGKTLAILQDLSGPKIRTGDFKDNQYELKKGSTVILTTTKPQNQEEIFINYPKLAEDVKPGERILLNDGKQILKVTKKTSGTKLEAVVLAGGLIKSRRGVNLPDSNLSIPSFTKKDKKDVEFAIKYDVDFIALSFVQTHKDILQLKRYLSQKNSKAKVIAKIETNQAIEDFDNILKVADGIMVARGDLAVEVGAQNVPMLQKTLVKKANNAGKIAIVATQMLETMISSPVPTRAEISDIANAILDGADTVMLSAETAAGEYPVEAVSVMAEAIFSTESLMDYTKRLNKPYAISKTGKINELTARHAAKLASELDANYIVAFTETGYTAQAISKYRIKQDILVVSQQQKTLRQTNLVFGAYPLARVHLGPNSNIVKLTKEILKEKKLYKKGAKVVIVAGSIFGQPGGTNTIITIKLD